MEKSQKGRAWNIILAVYFSLAVMFLCFFVGRVVGHKYEEPYETFRSGWAQVKQAIFHTEKPHFLGPVVYEGEGVVTLDPEKAYPGVTPIAGFWPEGNEWGLGVRLVDLKGNMLHEWRMDPKEVWPEEGWKDLGAIIEVSVTGLR